MSLPHICTCVHRWRYEARNWSFGEAKLTARRSARATRVRVARQCSAGVGGMRARACGMSLSRGLGGCRAAGPCVARETSDAQMLGCSDARVLELLLGRSDAGTPSDVRTLGCSVVCWYVAVYW